MVIEIKENETFVPEWNGNKELPPDQQVVIAYKTPNVSARKRILQKSTIHFNYDKDGNPTGGSGEIANDPEASVRAVENVVISNLEYTKNGKTVGIRTNMDLLVAPAAFYGLIKEFADHLVDEARKDVPEKN